MKTFIEVNGDQSVLHNGFKVDSPDMVVKVKAILDQMTGENHTIKSTFDGEISLVTEDGAVTRVPIDDWFMYSGNRSGFLTEESLKEYYKEYEVPEVEELERCPYVTVYFHKREIPLRFENVWGYLEMGSNYRFNYISQSTGVECSGVFPKENVDCILLGGNVIGEGPKEQA